MGHGEIVKVEKNILLRRSIWYLVLMVAGLGVYLFSETIMKAPADEKGPLPEVLIYYAVKAAAWGMTLAGVWLEFNETVKTIQGAFEDGKKGLDVALVNGKNALAEAVKIYETSCWQAAMVPAGTREAGKVAFDQVSTVLTNHGEFPVARKISFAVGLDDLVDDASLGVGTEWMRVHLHRAWWFTASGGPIEPLRLFPILVVCTGRLLLEPVTRNLLSDARMWPFYPIAAAWEIDDEFRNRLSKLQFIVPALMSDKGIGSTKSVPGHPQEEAENTVETRLPRISLFDDPDQLSGIGDIEYERVPQQQGLNLLVECGLLKRNPATVEETRVRQHIEDGVLCMYKPRTPAGKPQLVLDRGRDVFATMNWWYWWLVRYQGREPLTSYLSDFSGVATLEEARFWVNPKLSTQITISGGRAWVGSPSSNEATNNGVALRWSPPSFVGPGNGVVFQFDFTKHDAKEKTDTHAGANSG